LIQVALWWQSDWSHRVALHGSVVRSGAVPGKALAAPQYGSAVALRQAA
jgi:hypothetical protein